MKTHEAYLLWDLLAGETPGRESFGHQRFLLCKFWRVLRISTCIEGKVRAMAGVVQGSCKMLPSTMRLPSIWFSSRSAATTICTASKVDPPNIAHLCEKARLTLTPDEVKDFEPQIGRIVDWFAQLQDIDLANVAPAIRVGDIDPSKTLRPDTAKVFADREAMLAAAPDRDGPFLKVPKIMKENQE